MPEEPETPEPLGETLLEVGGVVNVPDAETLLEIGAPSIYADPELLEQLGNQSTAPASQADTRTVQSPGVGIGGRRYEIKAEVGRGGMGVVLRAFDRDLKRDVALKVARSDRTGSHSVARFIEEAQVTGQLSHPNIVPVHELGHEVGGRTFFTMKLVEGQSLARIVRLLRMGDADARREFPLTRRLYIFGQLLNCMAYAHDRGVIHRDLKPDNVMIGDYGEVMVMDWGLAKVRDRPEHVSRVTTTRLQTPGSETQDGAVIGTPAYMPPEQARGERDSIDERSDIYSLGAILYELLALHPPYEATTASELIARVMGDPPPPPSARNPDVLIPRGLERIVMRCLAPTQSERFQSARELQAALEAYEEEVESSADEGLFFSLLGKTFAFLLATSCFLLTAVVLVGTDDLHFREHLFDPGIYAGLGTMAWGTLAAWVLLRPLGAFDATHAILLWKRAGINSASLRGYYTAEAVRRAKWMYMLPVYVAIICAVALGNGWIGVIAAQMLGAALVAVLGIGAFEQGACRKLDALDAISGQDRRDMFWRWGVVATLLALAAFFMNHAGWEWRLQRMPADFRRGTLALHVVAVLAGVWVIAQIGHPFGEVNHALRTLLSRRMTPEQRTRIAPMARAFAGNALLFGAVGSLTWIGLLAPGGRDVPAAYYLMALTPLWSGILWSWFFRYRAGKLESKGGNELRRRYHEYLKAPQTPKTGRLAYFLAWSPFILGGMYGTFLFSRWAATLA